MSVWAVLATGESMSQAVADSIRGRCRVVAVSDAFRLAPWADAMVSNDSVWWARNLDAMQIFKGRKFCGAQTKMDGLEYIKPSGGFSFGINSGLQGMRCVPIIDKQAEKIILLGFDMRGTHYFGPHPKPLRNTTPHRFEVHKRQFKLWRGCPVVNCTPNSSLKCFRMGKLDEELPEVAKEADSVSTATRDGEGEAAGDGGCLAAQEA